MLITGGTGKWARLVARHLVAEHGVRQPGPREPARNGRRQASPNWSRTWRARAPPSRVAACDVADRASLAAVLADMPAAPAADGGRAHGGCAGGRHRRVADRQSIDHVLRAKVDGAVNLHELTREHNLSAFILFSSLSGTLGHRGTGQLRRGQRVPGRTGGPTQGLRPARHLAVLGLVGAEQRHDRGPGPGRPLPAAAHGHRSDADGRGPGPVRRGVRVRQARAHPGPGGRRRAARQERDELPLLLRGLAEGGRPRRDKAGTPRRRLLGAVAGWSPCPPRRRTQPSWTGSATRSPSSSDTPPVRSSTPTRRSPSSDSTR